MFLICFLIRGKRRLKVTDLFLEHGRGRTALCRSGSAVTVEAGRRVETPRRHWPGVHLGLHLAGGTIIVNLHPWLSLPHTLARSGVLFLRAAGKLISSQYSRGGGQRQPSTRGTVAHPLRAVSSFAHTSCFPPFAVSPLLPSSQSCERTGGKRSEGPRSSLPPPKGRRVRRVTEAVPNGDGRAPWTRANRPADGSTRCACFPPFARPARAAPREESYLSQSNRSDDRPSTSQVTPSSKDPSRAPSPPAQSLPELIPILLPVPRTSERAPRRPPSAVPHLVMLDKGAPSRGGRG